MKINMLKVVMIVAVVLLFIVSGRTSAKKAVEQNCTVVADLRADEIEAAVKRLNKKGIRVQETQIRVVNDKFTIVILDGQDDEDETEENEGRLD